MKKSGMEIGQWVEHDGLLEKSNAGPKLSYGRGSLNNN